MSQEDLLGSVRAIRELIFIEATGDKLSPAGLSYLLKLNNVLEREYVDAEAIILINIMLEDMLSTEPLPTPAPSATSTSSSQSSSSTTTITPTPQLPVNTSVNFTLVTDAFSLTVYPNVWMYGGGGLPVTTYPNATRANTAAFLMECANSCYNTKLCFGFSYYINEGNWSCALKMESNLQLLAALDYGWSADNIFAGFVAPKVNTAILSVAVNTTLTTPQYAVLICPNTWIDGAGGLPVVNFPAEASASPTYLLQCASMCYNTQGCVAISYYLSNNIWVCSLKEASPAVQVLPALSNGFLLGSIYAGFLNITTSA